MASDQAPIRVMIADDHPFAREGLELILRAAPYIEVIGTGDSFTLLLQQPDLAHCDVLLLDLGGMGAGPMVMVTQLVHAFPDLRIVIFSTSVDVAPELLQAGALGYVAKDDPVPHVVEAIRAANARQRYLSPIAQRYMDRTEGRRKQFRLVPKELMVLKLLAQGTSTQEIAVQMTIDPRTVQNYVTTLYHKTGCQDRMQLVVWYQRVYRAADLEISPDSM